jgi:hypothetical protein
MITPTVKKKQSATPIKTDESIFKQRNPTFVEQILTDDDHELVELIASYISNKLNQSNFWFTKQHVMKLIYREKAIKKEILYEAIVNKLHMKPFLTVADMRKVKKENNIAITKEGKEIEDDITDSDVSCDESSIKNVKL